MKFLLFADLHCHATWPIHSTKELEIMQKRAEEEGCDFMIHAGDLCFDAAANAEFIEQYNRFHIPSYHVLGNHDADKTPLETVLKMYRMPNNYYYFDCKGYRIIALDPNYFLLNGEYIHYDMGNYYPYSNGNYRDWVPPEQLKWLEETIASSPYPCLLIAHESFEREADGVRNQTEVRRIINEANARRPHSVLMCMNGHYHTDYLRILDNVCYLDVNSAVGMWIPHPHDLYAEELRTVYKGYRYLVCYGQLPVYCIVTVEGTTVTIDGVKGGLLDGVTREMTGNGVLDEAGRATTGDIQTAKITLG